MKLTGLYRERPGTRISPRWVAIWRTPKGNFTHVTLPYGARDTSVEVATAYAVQYPPEVQR